MNQGSGSYCADMYEAKGTLLSVVQAWACVFRLIASLERWAAVCVLSDPVVSQATAKNLKHREKQKDLSSRAGRHGGYSARWLPMIGACPPTKRD